MKWSMVENKYEVGYVDEYKTWLQNDLHGVVSPIPRTGREIEDAQTRPLSARMGPKGARVSTEGGRILE